MTGEKTDFKSELTRHSILLKHSFVIHYSNN